MINNKMIEELADGERLIKYSKEKVKRISDSENILEVFMNIGVPRTVSPGIDFIREDMGGLDRLSDFLNKESYTANISPKLLADKFKDFNRDIVVATYNNCLIVSRNKKELIMIDCETLKECFVNSSIENFIECVFQFNKMVNRVIEMQPDLDYYVEGLEEEDLKILETDIVNIEGEIGEFWDMVIQGICEEMEEL